MKLATNTTESILAFAKMFGLVLYPWQQKAFGTACRREGGHFVYRVAGISVPRGNGKSFGGAVLGLWRLLAGPPPQDILSAALDLDGAKVVLDHAADHTGASPARTDGRGAGHRTAHPGDGIAVDDRQ